MPSVVEEKLSESEYSEACKVLEVANNKNIIKQILTNRVIFPMQKLLQLFPNVRSLHEKSFDKEQKI